VYVRSEYKKPKKFAIGGAVILGHGQDAVLRPPPGEAPPIDVPDDDIPEAASDVSADAVSAAIARARSFRNAVPAVKVEPPENNRRIYSAPTSCREAPSWSGKREDRPGSITLSAAQREAARISGISIVEYAQNLIRLREEKAADPDRYGSGQ